MYPGIGINNNNSGRGQLFMFFMFIVFILIFTFYKNVIKRDKDIKKQQEYDIRQKIEEKIFYETNTNTNINDFRLNLKQKLYEIELERQKNIQNKISKEFMNVCYDLQVFGLRPEKIIIDITTTTTTTTTTGGSNKSDKIKRIMMIQHQQQQHHQQQQQKRSSFYINNEESEEQMIARRNMISGPIVYLFVIVLIYSLVKAATEITQHFRKKAAGDVEKRRCSLQEYASIKHERRFSKGQFRRRSTVMNMNMNMKSIDSQRIKHLNRSFEEKHNIYSGSINNSSYYQQNAGIIQEVTVVPVNSGQITTESGSPVKKFTNGIATKPAPLLRRCSVPVFAMGVGNNLRRTSMNDSFSEDDSTGSPDVKRRVRMIHRH